MSNEQKAFIPESSSTACRISLLSGRELFNRYFIADNKVSWSKDFFFERTRMDDNVPVYGLINALNGIPLQTIVTIIRDNVVSFVPAGYKLNSKVIVQDLEAILSENRAQTLEAVDKKLQDPSSLTTPFIIELSNFLCKAFIDGIKYHDTLILGQ